VSRLRFLSLFEVGEHLKHLGKLFSGGFPSGEGLHHELGGRTAESAVEEVPDQLPLGLLPRHLRLIDVGAGGFVPCDQAFGGHDLHELEHSGIADFALALEGGVDMADGARAEVPKDAEDVEFGVGGPWKDRIAHLGSEYYEAIRSVNENLRSQPMEIVHGCAGLRFRHCGCPGGQLRAMDSPAGFATGEVGDRLAGRFLAVAAVPSPAAPRR